MPRRVFCINESQLRYMLEEDILPSQRKDMEGLTTAANKLFQMAKVKYSNLFPSFSGLMPPKKWRMFNTFQQEYLGRLESALKEFTDEFASPEYKEKWRTGKHSIKTNEDILKSIFKYIFEARNNKVWSPDIFNGQLMDFLSDYQRIANQVREFLDSGFYNDQITELLNNLYTSIMTTGNNISNLIYNSKKMIPFYLNKIVGPIRNKINANKEAEANYKKGLEDARKGMNTQKQESLKNNIINSNTMRTKYENLDKLFATIYGLTQIDAKILFTRNGSAIAKKILDDKLSLCQKNGSPKKDERYINDLINIIRIIQGKGVMQFSNLTIGPKDNGYSMQENLLKYYKEKIEGKVSTTPEENQNDYDINRKKITALNDACTEERESAILEIKKAENAYFLNTGLNSNASIAYKNLLKALLKEGYEKEFIKKFLKIPHQGTIPLNYVNVLYYLSNEPLYMAKKAYSIAISGQKNEEIAKIAFDWLAKLGDTDILDTRKNINVKNAKIALGKKYPNLIPNVIPSKKEITTQPNQARNISIQPQQDASKIIDINKIEPATLKNDINNVYYDEKANSLYKRLKIRDLMIPQYGSKGRIKMKDGNLFQYY